MLLLDLRLEWIRFPWGYDVDPSGRGTEGVTNV